MKKNLFADLAAYMVHDLGPQRFTANDFPRNDWSGTEAAPVIRDAMERYGLCERDFHVSTGPVTRVSTDAGSVDLRGAMAGDEAVAALHTLFSQVACGVAQERMARLAGWYPGEELPYWAVTASDVLVQLLAEHGVAPVALWNAEAEPDEDGYVDRRALSGSDGGVDPHDPVSALLEDAYVRRFATGMWLSVTAGEVEYREDHAGARVTVPAELLRSDADDHGTLVGRRFGEVVRAEGELLDALSGYEVVAVQSSLSDRPTFRLAVGVRTLEPIPREALDRAGVVAPAGADADRPLWMLTPPELLRSYDPTNHVVRMLSGGPYRPA